MPNTMFLLTIYLSFSPKVSAYKFMCDSTWNSYSVAIHEARGDTEGLEIAHNVLHGCGKLHLNYI